MVTTKLNLSMTEPQVRQIYAKQGDTGRVLDIALDQTPEDGTLRILRPDGVEVASEAVTGGEISESGETVTFESMTEADVTELTVGIEPVQDLSHGDPSPTNICPITGHDEVTVTRTGKNRALFANESNQDRASFTYESETANKIVATSTSTGKFVGRYEAFLVKGVSYKLLYTNKGASTAPYIYRDRLWGSLVRTVYAGEVFTVDTTQTYVIGVYAPTNSTYDVEDFMVIEASETDTAWTPYQGSTYTTSLGQTVYGGTLDLVSGVLTVDRAMVDLGSLSWGMSGSGNTAFFYANTASLGVASDITTSLSYICENYSIVAVSSGGTATGMSFTSASQLRIRDATYSDATSFKTAMNGVQLCYELATPQTYTLTAQQIKTLVGTNNVWASSGDIVSIKFSYGGLLSELPSEATEIVGKCYCDVEQNGVSSMPFTLNVKKNERES